MSQRPSANRPAASSPTDGQENPLLPAPPRDDSHQGGRYAGDQERELRPEREGQSQMHSSQASEPTRTVQLPRELPIERERRQSGSSRSLGVHNILNPTDPEPAGASEARLASRITSSPQLGGPQHYSENRSTFTPQSYTTQQTVSPPHGEGQGGQAVEGRKILVPKSPRSLSLGSRVTATINAQQSPFLTSGGHVYTAEPGSGLSSEVPPMPIPLGYPQHPSNVHRHTTPSDPRRTTSATMAAPLRTPLSQSASPSPSIRSTYSAPGQPSAAVQYMPGQGQSQGGSYFPGSSFVSGPQQGDSFQIAHPKTEGPYMTPLSESIFMGGRPQSGGQDSGIRMIPISTDQGQLYMPVEVKAASKVADEKRARNAGASARFRARRKEKEKETNNTIGNMQKELKDKDNQLKDMERERDFYKAERDRFRDIVARTPATRDLASQAPPSPRMARAQAYPPPPSESTYQTEAEARHESGRPPQRRRVNPSGDFAFGGPPSTFPPPIASSFPPAPYPSQGYIPGPASDQSQLPTSLPPLRLDNATAGPLPSGPLPPTTRPPSFEHHRNEYERGWPTGPEGRKPSRQ